MQLNTRTQSEPEEDEDELERHHDRTEAIFALFAVGLVFTFVAVVNPGWFDKTPMAESSRQDLAIIGVGLMAVAAYFKR